MFVHKNLLVSLCVVYIVMILDAFVLTNRKQTPVSFFSGSILGICALLVDNVFVYLFVN